MDTKKFSKEERITFVKLYIDLTKIVVNDILIEPEFASTQIERITALLNSLALSKDEKARYTELIEIFASFARR
ncbi:hypothetical protein L6472_06040 [Prevotella sp. E13-17]|uniref:hypothetical protein n=1 Tax=Prevotella sp. E13-17 TaxID=2913616 RepID=UPI001EDA316A|nr:hypothetical protein [Prevotella sp. E13-17]UKK52138.1 hypothetical protein L6472_06040 [Prevotella sp. E13-17]